MKWKSALLVAVLGIITKRLEAQVATCPPPPAGDCTIQLTSANNIEYMVSTKVIDKLLKPK